MNVFDRAIKWEEIAFMSHGCSIIAYCVYRNITLKDAIEKYLNGFEEDGVIVGRYEGIWRYIGTVSEFL